MKRSKSVTFSLAPIVRLYNKIVSPQSSPELSSLVQKEQEQEPKPVWGQQELSALQQEVTVAPSATLSISVPKEQSQDDDDNYEEPPAYDKSPLTPRSWDEILAQRHHEAEVRTKEIKRALNNFHASSPVMSPLALPSPVLK